MSIKFRELLEQSSNTNTTKTDNIELNESVVDSLQSIVNSLVDAANVAQVAHWNLRSKSFISLHPWLGETYQTLNDMVDGVAEQIKISNINLMVNVSPSTIVPFSNENILFEYLLSSIERVNNELDMAADDISIPRPLQNLIDNWITTVSKIIWTIKASKQES